MSFYHLHTIDVFTEPRKIGYYENQTKIFDAESCILKIFLKNSIRLNLTNKSYILLWSLAVFNNLLIGYKVWFRCLWMRLLKPYFASLDVYFFQLFRLCTFLIEFQPIQLKIKITPISGFPWDSSCWTWHRMRRQLEKPRRSWVYGHGADYADGASDLWQESKYIIVSWIRNLFIWTSTKLLSCVIVIVSWW